LSSLRRRAEWLPALLVGVACATAAEIAIGVLLYTGTGLMRSLSTVLVVEAAALAIGLWSAPGPGPCPKFRPQQNGWSIRCVPKEP